MLGLVDLTDAHHRRRHRPAEGGPGNRARRALSQARRADRPQLGLRDIEIVEISESRADDAGKRMLEESIALANVIPQGAAVVLLDARGETSTAPASPRSWRMARRRPAGGGVPDRRRRRPGAEPARQGELRLAFGAATWPHQLVRIMLLEQIYRAVTILTGHPYHRA